MMAKYFPLSCRSVTSPTTPEPRIRYESSSNAYRTGRISPIAIVLADPAACRIRSIISSQYALVGIRANPTQASARTPRQNDKTSLLPKESDKVPKSIGAGIEVY